MSYKKITELEIDRNLWSRGKFSPKGNNRLLLENGSMCCLGFMCLAQGVPESAIRNHSYPQMVLVDEPIPFLTSLSRLGRFKDTAFVRQATELNDERSISESVREQQLSNHFKTIGISLTFVN